MPHVKRFFFSHLFLHSTPFTLSNGKSIKNLRLVDAAVVEDQVHAGKLLPRLLRLQIQLYDALVTYKESQNTMLPELFSHVSLVYTCYHVQ